MEHSLLTNFCRGIYWNRKFRREILPQLQARTPILVESHVVKVLEQQGFHFDFKRDNKSEYDPEDLYPALEKYFEPIGWEPQWDKYDQAWAVTCAKFCKPADLPFLDALDLREVTNHVKLMKASSAPYFVKKGEALKRDLLLADDILVGRRVPPPCVAYHRIQHGKTGPKTRLVWGYPLSMTLIEGCFAAPLIEAFLTRRTPMVFGISKLGISARLQSLANRDYQVSLDFSKFDASIHAKLIQRAFWILKSWFASNEALDKLWKQIENYFVFTPIVMPDGNIYIKHRGVPSGSWFTQMIDSIINYFAIQYANLIVKGDPNMNLLVLGDDSIFSCYKFPLIGGMSVALKSIGLTVNIDKTAKSKNGIGMRFLGHDWTHGIPDRPLHETAIRMAFPERWVELDVSREQRCNYRIASYLSDSKSAYSIYKELPWNVIMPGIVPMAFAAEQGPLLTGWQTFMQTFTDGNKVITPAKLFYFGVCA